MKLQLFIFLIFLTLLLPVQMVLADDTASSGDDVDSLFDDSGTAKTAAPVKDDNSSKNNILDTVLDKTGLQIQGSYSVTAGYSPGWEYFPINYGQLLSSNAFEDTMVLKLSSLITLDAQISRNFRFLQKYSVSFPTFTPVITEMFCDYNLLDHLSLRVGRQNITWGASRNFKFTNLPARLPDNFTGLNNTDSIADTDSYAVKLDVPIGVGGVEGLVFARNGYFKDPAHPSMDEFGYGGKINLALPLADITLATFYQKEMNYRTFLSVSKTVFKNVDLYAEALLTLDLKNLNGTAGTTTTGSIIVDTDAADTPISYTTLEDLPVDKGADIGFYTDFLSGKLKVNGEYFYNGEETQLTLLGSNLYYGHNIAANISFKADKLKTTFFSQFMYNFYDYSGTLLTGAKVDAFPNLSLVAAAPAVLGPVTGGYYKNNADPLGRQFSLVFSAVITGKTVGK